MSRAFPQRWQGAVAVAVAMAMAVSACGSDAPVVVAACPPGQTLDAGMDGVSSDGGATHDGHTDAAPLDAIAGKKPSATDRLFDPLAPLRTIDLTVAEEDWAWLQKHAVEETYVPATVASAGESAVAASVRYKGAFGSLLSCFDKDGNQVCKKLSLKVSFNEKDKKGRMFGVRKLILNSCNRDPSCLRERLGYTLFADAGLVAPRAVHVLVRVNGGPASVYLLVEAIDKEFLEDHFANEDGNLYKEAWPTAEQSKAWKNALKTNESTSDVSRMLAFSKAAAGASPATFNAAVEPWIDRETMARYFVVDQLTNNWDGIWKFYCPNKDTCRNHNFYIYDDPTSGRFVVLPWDLDHTFTQPNTDMARSWWDDGPTACDLQNPNGFIATRAPQCDPLLAGLMRQSWDKYVAHLDTWTQAGALLSAPRMHQRLERWRAQLHEPIANDPKGPGLVQWWSATSQLRQILTAQVAEARALLTWKPPSTP